MPSYVQFDVWQPSTGGVSGVTLDSAGRVNKPNNPAFHARSLSTKAMTGSDFIFDAVQINVGNCYSSSTGRFTAPIAGVYWFHCEVLGNTDNTSTLDIRFFINGNQAQAASTYVPNYSAGNYRKAALSALLSLSLNDYVSVRSQNGSSIGNLYGDNGGFLSATGSGHTNFQGFLVS